MAEEWKHNQITDSEEFLRHCDHLHPQNDNGHLQADDHKAIREQTTTGRPQADDHGPSGSGRPFYTENQIHRRWRFNHHQN